MRLQTRILALFLVLLLVVLTITLTTVSQATYRHTLQRAEEELDYARRIFLDRLQSRQQALRQGTKALAAEEALRQAIFAEAGSDRPSVRLVLDNHRSRVNADLSFLIGLDGTILVETADPRREGQPFPFPSLLAEEPAGATTVTTGVLGGVAYQLHAEPYYIPVSAPQPSYWLVLGRALDDSLARELRDLMGIDFAVLSPSAAGRGATVLASSMGTVDRNGLALRPPPAFSEPGIFTLAHQDFLAVTAELGGTHPPLTGLLLRPTSEALLDFRQLSGRFVGIALGAAALAILGAFLVARGVARPIRALEAAAQRIAAGDYAAELPLSGGGEVATLAREFGAMQQAVRSRELAIEHLAFHDDLTGLPNRRDFERELAKAIEIARSSHSRLAVAMIDLDRFRDINDALGHHVGDRLLLEIASRLRGAAGASALAVARLGGDEFAVAVAVESLTEARASVHALRSALGAALEIDELRVDVSASIGIAVFPDHGSDPASLLKQAEVAMYVAKHGRLEATFYDSSQDRHSIARLSLVGDLREALEGGGLALAYQPKLDLATDGAGQVEVLLRWRHPRLGLVSPADFIPLAEQTGLIRDVTAWVLRHAIAQLAAWREGGLDVTAAINLSALDLHDPALPLRVREALARHGVAPSRLVLEITESSVMAEPETARRLLDELTASGVRIAIDDFGTGYSSLAQLKRLPVQELKVDKSFVLDMMRSADLLQIVRSTIELGHGLGLLVVAEGVESAETLSALRGMGCDLAQGHHISEPLAAADFERWLRARAVPVA